MPAEIIGTVVTSGTGLGTTATSHTFSRPTNTLQVGDYVWAVYSQRGSTSAPGTPPSGWTSTGFVSISTSPGGGSGLWYKRFTSQAEIDADTGSYSASFTARALLTSCGIVRGADSVSSPSNASDTELIDTLTYSSIAATRQSLCLAWIARNGAGAPGFEFLQPSGFTELVDFTATTQDVSQGVASRSFSGDTGSVAYSYSTTTTRLNGGMILFLVADVTLSGAIAASSGLSGNLTAEKQLSATVAAVSGFSGTLTTAKQLSGTIAAVSALTGALSASDGLSGAIAASSSITGDLSVGKPLAGTIAGDSSLTGALTTAKQLGGTVAGTSELSGAIAVSKPLSGAIAATSGVSGALTVEKRLASSIAASSTLSGDLATEKRLGGAIAGASSMAGDLTVEKPLSGAIAAVSSISGSLDGQVNADLSGVITVSSAIAGALTTEKRLAGTIAAVSGVNGELSRPAEGIAIAALVVEPPAITALVVEPIRILVTA